MPKHQRRSWPWFAIGGLILLNVALIAALVLRQTMQDDAITAVPGATPASTGSAETTPSATTSSTATPSGTPTGSASGESTRSSADDGEVTDPRRVLAVSTSTVAWRAQVGDCGEDSTVEVSTDGGRTWRATEPGLGAIVRLKSYGEQAVFALGADDDCRPSYAWAGSPDAPWQTDRSMAEDIWYRVPGEVDLVHAPGGKTSRPCGNDLVGLAGLGTFEAAAICADGRLRTIREGDKWTTVRSDTGAVAVNADDNRFTIVRAMDGCDGLVVQHFSATGPGLSDKPTNCWEIPWTQSEPVAVASRDDVTWLWAGDDVRRR